MGAILWFEETNEPKQAIIRKAIRKDLLEHIEKSRWDKKNQGIVVKFDHEVLPSENQTFISGARASKGKYDFDYKLICRGVFLKSEMDPGKGRDEINWYKNEKGGDSNA